MSLSFKDYFSRNSDGYAKYRPTYPKEMYDLIVKHCVDKNIVWDVATGSGQAANSLTAYFDQVIATDPSASQLANAKQHPKIRYHQETAEVASENTPVTPGSVDLVTIACALHWFDHAKFNERVKVVAKPGGLIAAWTYEAIRCEDLPKIGELVGKFLVFHDEFWPPEREYIKSHYRSVPWPFEKVFAGQPDIIEDFACHMDWSCEDLENYLYTWSCSNIYADKTGKDPMDCIKADLRQAFGAGKRKLTCNLYLRLGRVHKQ